MLLKVTVAPALTVAGAVALVDPCLNYFVSMLTAVQSNRAKLNDFKNQLSQRQLQKLGSFDNNVMAGQLITDVKNVVEELKKKANQNLNSVGKPYTPPR